MLHNLWLILKWGVCFSFHFVLCLHSWFGNSYVNKPIPIFVLMILIPYVVNKENHHRFLFCYKIHSNYKVQQLCTQVRIQICSYMGILLSFKAILRFLRRYNRVVCFKFLNKLMKLELKSESIRTLNTSSNLLVLIRGQELRIVHRGRLTMMDTPTRTKDSS